MTEITERQKINFMIHVAESAQMYPEMTKFVKDLIKLGVELTKDERTSLHLSYHNYISNIRTQLSTLEKKNHCPKHYLMKIQKEIENISMEVIELLTVYLIPGTKDIKSLIYYHKMKAAYYRYILERNRDEKIINLALDAYKYAKELSDHHLSPIDHQRLSLVMEIASFYSYMLGSSDISKKICVKALKEALETYEALPDEEAEKYNTILLADLKLMSSIDDN